MKTILDYYDRPDRFTLTSVIERQEEVEGKDDIEIFENFYKLNNSLRYCNGSYYKFQSSDWQNRYNDWLKSDDYKKKSFNLFYGRGGVVD